jgi:hypothetical protein
MSSDAMDAAKAFSRFAPEEVRRLERYSARTRKLWGCPFMQESTTLSWTISGGVDEPTTSTLAGVDERQLHEALMLFRPLHLQQEKAGFSQVQAMVKRHAYESGTDEGKEAIEGVRSFTENLSHILGDQRLIQLREQRVDTVGAVVSEGGVTPARIFDDFLYGHYFHEDEERINRIGDWLPSELQRFLFVGTVHDVASLYVRFARYPEAILAEATLHS